MKYASLVLLLMMSGCTIMGRQAEVRVSIASDQGRRAIGHNPVANFSVIQPLPYGLEVFYQHTSSIVQKNDPGTVDQFGVGLCVKFPLRPCN